MRGVAVEASVVWPSAAGPAPDVGRHRCGPDQPSEAPDVKGRPEGRRARPVTGHDGRVAPVLRAAPGRATDRRRVREPLLLVVRPRLPAPAETRDDLRKDAPRRRLGEALVGTTVAVGAQGIGIDTVVDAVGVRDTEGEAVEGG